MTDNASAHTPEAQSPPSPADKGVSSSEEPPAKRRKVGNSSHDNDCPLPSARGLSQAWINAVRRNFKTETYETSSGNYDELFNETLKILQEDRGIRLNGSPVASSSHSSSPSKTEEDTSEADQGYLGDDEVTEESVESQLENVGLANAMTHSELSADDSS